jgi:hypothetical protein
MMKLSGAWFILLTTIALYYFFMTFNMTQALWNKGLWLSDNDVLHVGMTLWILYILPMVIRREFVDLKN